MSCHYLNQWWNIFNWTLGNKFQWNFHQNTTIFIHENAFENIFWIMVAILSGPRCNPMMRRVKTPHHVHLRLYRCSFVLKHAGDWYFWRLIHFSKIIVVLSVKYRHLVGAGSWNPGGRQGAFILHIHYHGCWWHGDTTGSTCSIREVKVVINSCMP